MRAILIAVVVAVCPVLARGETLVDFSAAHKGQEHPMRDKTGRVTGNLIGKWIDNSDWAKVWVDYSPMREQEKQFLRIRVSKIEDGRAQLMHVLPGMEKEAYYRLSIVARSASRTPISIGIRDRGQPYTMVWEDSPKLDREWTTRTVDFRLAQHAAPVALMILVHGTGDVDMASLQLQRRTREELVEEIRKENPGPAPKNLLRQTTFPLGMPCGWALNRELSDGDDVTIEPGKDGVVTGGAPLSIKPRERFNLTSAPFEAPRVFENHTASVYVRGKGDGKLIVIADGRWIASKAFSASEKWSRVAVTFRPALLAKAHVLMIQGGGAMEIDGVQVNSGERPGDLAMQGACEAHLALVSAESAARVVFEDEPAKLAYAVCGSVANGAGLKIRAVHADHGEAVGEVVDVTRTPRGELDLASYLRGLLGPFRIETWVADESGKAMSPVSEMVIYRLHRPRYWGADAPESPFGTHTLAAHRHPLMAKAVGVNWVRLHDAGTVYAGWRYVEKEKGKWTFNDEPLNRYRKQNLKILGALATSPNWATNFERAHDGYFDQFYQPKNLEDYANYVRVIASRYKGVIDTWDVWNEPWNKEWWAIRYDEEKGKKQSRLGYITSEHPEADFARLVDVAVKNAKAVDPSLRVLGVNSTTDGAGKKWTAGIVAAEGYKLPDVYCYHQYTSAPNLFPGDAVERGLAAAMGEIKEKLGGRFDKPVWMTEGSAMRDRIGSGMYLHTFPAGAGEDFIATGDSLCRYVVSLLANGCSKVFLYTMHGHNTFGSGGEWRVLVTDEGYLHPSAAAHSNMAWHLEDTKFSKRIELAPGLGAYLFAGRGRSVAVLSNTSGEALACPALAGADLKVVDLFGNPAAEAKTVGEKVVYVSMEADAAKLEQALTQRK